MKGAKIHGTTTGAPPDGAEAIVKAYASTVGMPPEARIALVKGHVATVGAPPYARIGCPKFFCSVVVETRADHRHQQVHG